MISWCYRNHEIIKIKGKPVARGYFCHSRFNINEILNISLLPVILLDCNDLKTMKSVNDRQIVLLKFLERGRTNLGLIHEKEI